jgi:hypothetical protein
LLTTHFQISGLLKEKENVVSDTLPVAISANQMPGLTLAIANVANCDKIRNLATKIFILRK